LLPHAEYAVIEATNGDVAVSLRRVPLDKAELRQAARAAEHPLKAWLTEAYA